MSNSAISRRFALLGGATLLGSAVLGASGYVYWRRGKAQIALNSTYTPPSGTKPLCIKGEHPSIVLIGDSRVSRWKPLPVFQAGFTMVNRGQGGESLLSLRSRYNDDALACKPMAVVLQSGINDLVGASFLDAAQSDAVCLATIERFKAIAADSSTAGVPLIITTIIPPGRATKLYLVEGVSHLSRLVARVNQELVKVNWPQHVQLLDVRDQLSDKSGLMLRREFQDDTLHLSEAGYVVLSDMLISALSKN